MVQVWGKQFDSVSKKLNRISIRLSNYTSRYILKRTENRDPNTYVYSSVIQNNQQVVKIPDVRLQINKFKNYSIPIQQNTIQS